MRPALVSPRDQITLKRLIAEQRNSSTNTRNRLSNIGRRRSQGGGVKGAKDDHVQVWDGSTAGDILEGNENNLLPARVRHFYNGVMTEGFSCWLGFVDWYDADTSQTLYALNGKHFYARRVGSFNVGGGSTGDSRPFYVATMGTFECWCKPDTNTSAGGAVTVALYNNDLSDSGLTRASTSVPFIDVTAGQWCIMARTMGTYIVQPAEC